MSNVILDCLKNGIDPYNSWHWMWKMTVIHSIWRVAPFSGTPIKDTWASHAYIYTCICVYIYIYVVSGRQSYLWSEVISCSTRKDFARPSPDTFNWIPRHRRFSSDGFQTIGSTKIRFKPVKNVWAIPCWWFLTQSQLFLQFEPRMWLRDIDASFACLRFRKCQMAGKKKGSNMFDCCQNRVLLIHWFQCNFHVSIMFWVGMVVPKPCKAPYVFARVGTRCFRRRLSNSSMFLHGSWILGLGWLHSSSISFIGVDLLVVFWWFWSTVGLRKLWNLASNSSSGWKTCSNGNAARKLHQISLVHNTAKRINVVLRSPWASERSVLSRNEWIVDRILTQTIPTSFCRFCKRMDKGRWCCLCTCLQWCGTTGQENRRFQADVRPSERTFPNNGQCQSSWSMVQELLAEVSGSSFTFGPRSSDFTFGIKLPDRSECDEISICKDGFQYPSY